MKVAKLLHNPGAGDEEHDKKQLLSWIEKEGFECRYSSTKKKGWDDIEDDTDFLVIAGGDGTVRKVAGVLMRRKKIESTWPITLLPLGTANNISKTLGLKGDPKVLVKAISTSSIKKFDVGRMEVDGEPHFFLESFGYGIFPYLMMEMKRKKKEEGESDDPEVRLKTALKVMHELILSYEPRYCHIEVDGVDHSGKYLLAEVMNTRTIGPNLCLSPNADTGDGIMEVVLVKEEDKQKFADHILAMVNGKEEKFSFTSYKGKSIIISWDGTHVHNDDEILKLEKGEKLEIELLEGALEFMVPAK